MKRCNFWGFEKTWNFGEFCPIFWERLLDSYNFYTSNLFCDPDHFKSERCHLIYSHLQRPSTTSMQNFDKIVRAVLGKKWYRELDIHIHEHRRSFLQIRLKWVFNVIESFFEHFIRFLVSGVIHYFPLVVSRKLEIDPGKE